ncbi:MAG: thymidylate synthase [Actinobacteria bacterium]|nr:thymidylate synthase [Actinomycetota bacterium]
MDVIVSSASWLLRRGIELLNENASLYDTRNGKAMAMDRPIMVELLNPRKRIINSPIRKANPYFHVFEAIWMFAGWRDVEPLLSYNSGMANYAEPAGYIHGAYGMRWRNTFGHDQIEFVVNELKHRPNSRQAVMAMYDPALDQHSELRDRPCNTHIYFRVVEGCLDMLVCNRSNDLVWGMAGSNIVHMTMLHELIAMALGYEVGIYRVVTNNLHAYEQHFPMLEQFANKDGYEDLACVQLLRLSEDYQHFLSDCEAMVRGENETVRTWWAKTVGVPMILAHEQRKAGDITAEKDMANSIDCPAIRGACLDWEGAK